MHVAKAPRKFAVGSRTAATYSSIDPVTADGKFPLTLLECKGDLVQLPIVRKGRGLRRASARAGGTSDERALPRRRTRSRDRAATKARLDQGRMATERGIRSPSVPRTNGQRAFRGNNRTCRAVALGGIGCSARSAHNLRFPLSFPAFSRIRNTGESP